MTAFIRHWALRHPLAYSITRGSFFCTTAILMLEYTVATTHQIRGPSMYPTLSPSFSSTGACDHILVSKSPFASFHDSIQRGDVVVFRKPTDPKDRAVKRVVALPGDVVVRRRPRPEANRQQARDMGFAEVPKEIIVSPGQVWVEGDNVDERKTFDSNDFGALPINLITGSAIAIVWPPHRWGKLADRPSDRSRNTTVIPRVQHPDLDADPDLPPKFPS